MDHLMHHFWVEVFIASPSLSYVYVYDGISFTKGQTLPLETEIFRTM